MSLFSHILVCAYEYSQALDFKQPDDSPCLPLLGLAGDGSRGSPLGLSCEGPPTGLLIDIWNKQVAPAIGESIEWMPWSAPGRMLWQFKNNEVDVHIGISKNSERLKVVDFSQRPVVTLKWYLIVLKENKKTNQLTTEQLKGKTISTFHNVILPKFLDKHRDLFSTMHSSPVGASSQALDQLLNKRVWAIFYGSHIPVLDHAAGRKICHRLDLIRIPGVDQVAYYVGFSKQMPLHKRRSLERKIEKVFQGIDLLSMARKAIIKKDPDCAQLFP